MSKKNRYAVYVTDDNGWRDGCPDSETVFFGAENISDFDGLYVHPMDGGSRPVGHVEIQGIRAARGLLARLNCSGDWIAPEEVNPTGEESRPSYAVRAVPPGPSGKKHMESKKKARNACACPRTGMLLDHPAAAHADPCDCDFFAATA